MVIIGIAGASASGKSLLAKNVIEGFDSDQVVMMSEDSYYKDQRNMSKAQRNLTNYDHPDAMDHELMAQHLDSVSCGPSRLSGRYIAFMTIYENQKQCCNETLQGADC